jgi:hypothetical protein
MISKRVWVIEKTRGGGAYPKRMKLMREGWFLFGLIPLYVRDMNAREWRYD